MLCANLGRYVSLLYLIHSVWSLGPAQLTISSNPVYHGEPVTLTFTYGAFGSGITFLNIVVDAFNGSRKEGFLYCASLLPCNATGVFSGKSLDGWPTIPVGAVSVSWTTATSSLELYYNCSITVTDSKDFYIMPCGPTFLPVYVCPSPPKLLPSPIVFNNSDKAVVSCEAPNGNPAADVLLTAIEINGTRPSSNNNNNSAFLELFAPLSNWHKATVICRVINHNCSNGNATVRPDVNVTSPMMINHIINTSIPDVVCTNESTVVLNCAIYITSYPGVTYKWTTPPESNLTSSLYLESLPVPQGQSGSYNCTATNNLTLARVVIVFVVSNICRPTSTTIVTPEPQHCSQCWIIGLVLGVIVVIIVAIVIGVLCKRGHFSKGKKKPGVEPEGTDHQSDHASHLVRLLVAAEGVVSQLSVRALSTTAIVEYSDRLCSLSGLLEKVEQAVARCPMKFRSVALLLRQAKVGVTLSEVDQAVLNSSSIQDEKGEKVRGFIARLAKICLDEHGGTRMDILNYNGKAPMRLSEALTKFLGIRTTVSKDYFGVGTPTEEKGGHAVVADTYFDRNNLGEVVYAELQLPSVKPQTQPRPTEESVTYSEIRR